jgi:hypothetical protein
MCPPTASIGRVRNSTFVSAAQDSGGVDIHFVNINASSSHKRNINIRWQFSA